MSLPELQERQESLPPVPGAHVAAHDAPNLTTSNAPPGWYSRQTRTPQSARERVQPTDTSPRDILASPRIGTVRSHGSAVARSVAQWNAGAGPHSIISDSNVSRVEGAGRNSTSDTSSPMAVPVIQPSPNAARLERGERERQRTERERENTGNRGRELRAPINFRRGAAWMRYKQLLRTAAECLCLSSTIGLVLLLVALHAQGIQLHTNVHACTRTRTPRAHARAHVCTLTHLHIYTYSNTRTHSSTTLSPVRFCSHMYV